MPAPTPPPKTLLSFIYNVSYDRDFRRAFHLNPDYVMQEDFGLSKNVRDVLEELGVACTPNKPIDDKKRMDLLDKLLGFIGKELAAGISPTFW
jgi:hypothetical protein